MTREELIKQCRYYKGEEKCPYEYKHSGKDLPMVWSLEHRWCKFLLEDTNAFAKDISRYRNAGMETYRKGEAPLSLMAFMFNRYWYWHDYDTEEEVRKHFADWYERNYLGAKN